METKIWVTDTPVGQFALTYNSGSIFKAILIPTSSLKKASDDVHKKSSGYCDDAWIHLGKAIALGGLDTPSTVFGNGSSLVHEIEKTETDQNGLVWVSKAQLHLTAKDFHLIDVSEI